MIYFKSLIAMKFGNHWIDSAVSHCVKLKIQRIVIATSLIALAFCGLTEAGGQADQLRLEVTRDLWMSSVDKEADANLGGSPRLKLKSFQELSIVDLDPVSLRGKKVQSATLHLHTSGGEILRRVTVSSLGSDWVEGTSGNYAAQPGSSCFNFRRYPKEPWAYPGSDLTAVMLGQGGTIWRSVDAAPPDAEGWQTIEIAPELIAARGAGISHGFVIFDDTGSEWTRDGEKFNLRLFPNRFVFSRDSQTRTAPYFTVKPGADDHEPPAPIRNLKSEISDLPAGEAEISWTTPADAGPAGTVGFVAEVDGQAVPQYLLPAAGAPGSVCTLHLRDMKLGAGQKAKFSIRAIDGAGNQSQPAGIDVQLSSWQPRPLPGKKPAVAEAKASLPKVGDVEIAIIDALDKVQPVTGQMIPPQAEGYLSSNHLWDGKQIHLQAAKNEFVSFQVLVRGRVQGLKASLQFSNNAAAPQVTFDRFRYVRSKNGPIGDPLVPIGDGLSVPDPASGIESQTSGSFLCEIYVPHEAATGMQNGTLAISAGGNELRIPLSLTVWDFTLPDHLSFIPEMNCYGLPANELDYYRLAHRNRVVINRVPYSQGGIVEDGCAPKWDSKSRTLDFTEWDKRFRPLLDGSAFADLPRKGVPLDIFYLPLHENWPTPMEGNYNGSYWADQAFPQSYRENFVSASKQFAEHFDHRKWNDTLFLGFFNGKNNYKERGWSRGSSPWLLDEPANFQDFWALHFFGTLFHEGVNHANGSEFPTSRADPAASPLAPSRNLQRPGAKMLFRADISRPQWQRDALDDVLDYSVVAGGEFHRYHRLVMDRKRRLGQVVLPYGTANDPADSNVQPLAWCWDSWTLGGDGVLPWQVIGNANSWKSADATSLFYPGGPAGQKTPMPSIRLKAFLRGEQDVEYLVLLSQLEKESQLLFGRRVREAISLTGQRRGTGFTGGEDAGVIAFDHLRPQDLWAIRVQIGEVISSRHPEAKNKLVDFQTPRRGK